MARPLRIEFSGALYHVMTRGNERRTIVVDDTDRAKRFELLQRTVETYGWRVHAVALMNNHEHLFLETPDPNLSVGMHFLNGSYATYFNRRHGRVGHLLQGRFKAHLIETEGHYREISRYIHLNPVRAGLVRRPEEWRWSSYPGYCRPRHAIPWMTYDRVLSEFGAGEREARQGYVEFVEAGLRTPLKSPWSEAYHDLVIGSETFLERVQDRLSQEPPNDAQPQRKRLAERPPLDRIVAVVGEHLGCSTTVWGPRMRSHDPGRAVAAYIARRRFGYAATLVAQRLGYVGPSSVSRAIRRVESEKPLLEEVVEQLVYKLGDPTNPKSLIKL